MSKLSHTSAIFDNALWSRAGSPDVFLSSRKTWQNSWTFSSFTLPKLNRSVGDVVPLICSLLAPTAKYSHPIAYDIVTKRKIFFHVYIQVVKKEKSQHDIALLTSFNLDYNFIKNNYLRMFCCCYHILYTLKVGVNLKKRVKNGKHDAQWWDFSNFSKVDRYYIHKHFHIFS